MSDNFTKLEQVNALLGYNKFTEAFNILDEMFKDKSEVSQIINLKGQYNGLKDKIINGTISTDEKIRFENQIRASILLFTSKYLHSNDLNKINRQFKTDDKISLISEQTFYLLKTICEKLSIDRETKTEYFSKEIIKQWVNLEKYTSNFKDNFSDETYLYVNNGDRNLRNDIITDLTDLIKPLEDLKIFEKKKKIEDGLNQILFKAYFDNSKNEIDTNTVLNEIVDLTYKEAKFSFKDIIVNHLQVFKETFKIKIRDTYDLDKVQIGNFDSEFNKALGISGNKLIAELEAKLNKKEFIKEQLKDFVISVVDTMNYNKNLRQGIVENGILKEEIKSIKNESSTFNNC
jgi:hypothetical protein